jgi:hypothetical protein
LRPIPTYRAIARLPRDPVILVHQQARGIKAEGPPRRKKAAASTVPMLRNATSDKLRFGPLEFGLDPPRTIRDPVWRTRELN